MLRQPGSKYEAGRSATLLKVKSFRDAEAIVIGHLDGAGKHKGRLGALQVRLPSGVEFSVGTGFSDKERGSPPAVGTTVTFRYQELSEAGVPRFPSYVGARIDAPVSPTAPVAAPAPPPPPDKNKSGGVAKISVPVMSAAAAPAPSSTAAGKSRRFEFTEGTSSKFWEITQSGSDVTTRWGRIGSAGQSKTKTFANTVAAERQVAKLIEEKTEEGYLERTAK
jgi:DNA ligase-1